MKINLASREIRRRSFALGLSVLSLLAMSSSAVFAENAYDQTVDHPAIPLLDEAGNHVLDSGKPYSSKVSCGSSGCHDYDSISHAYHFEMGRDEASDDYGKKRGIPQLASPGYFGGYTCMGGSRPSMLAKKSNETNADFLDEGAAGLIQNCAGCHPGGGFMELDREGTRYDQKDIATIPNLDGDYYNRGTDPDHQQEGALDLSIIGRWDWKKSGVVEADCMVCHADFKDLKKFPASQAGLDDESDGSDSAFDFWKELRVGSLVEKGFFREAGTAMWEFLNIAPDKEEGLQLVNFSKTITRAGNDSGYDLVLGDDGKPVMNWNPAAFDENRKAHIQMLRFPGNDNCMLCHRTSNSRRGFYGYGDNAVIEFDDNGIIKEDYQDDVHKGKMFTDTNGQKREINNCNACHTRNYFNEPHENVEINVDHNFLKGNSDMDVRNDLDFAPNAKSCEYCHGQSAETVAERDENNLPKAVIPSGHDTIHLAHRELWKGNGDMAGYSASSLDKITKTHLDVVSCQGCHITDKASRGNPLQIMYRYRLAENGKSLIFPYLPKIRAYWKDKNSDRVLSRFKNDSIFDVRSDDSGDYAAIINVINGDELGRVSYSVGRHGPRYGTPDTYDAYVAAKQAYDFLMAKDGFANTNMQQIWTESNEYVLSHNVRSSTDSVPCQDCHSRKQSGAFSSLVSVDGILGEAQERKVVSLPDKRLVEEGIVVLDLEYFKLQNDGSVIENVSDILFATKVDPHMTIAKASSATIAEGEYQRVEVEKALDTIGIIDEAIRATMLAELGGGEVFLYNNHQGDPTIVATAIIARSAGTLELLLPSYRVGTEVLDGSSASSSNLDSAGLGTVTSKIVSLVTQDANKQEVSQFSSDVLVKIPYTGSATSINDIQVANSQDGTNWSIFDGQIIALNPHTELSDGYVIFATSHFTEFAIIDKSNSIGGNDGNDGNTSTSTKKQLKAQYKVDAKQLKAQYKADVAAAKAKAKEDKAAVISIYNADVAAAEVIYSANKAPIDAQLAAATTRTDKRAIKKQLRALKKIHKADLKTLKKASKVATKAFDKPLKDAKKQLKAIWKTERKALKAAMKAAVKAL
ncbi:MAG: cytochrome C [Methylococcaceae bacterium]